MTTRKKAVATLPEELKKPNEDCFVEGILAIADILKKKVDI